MFLRVGDFCIEKRKSIFSKHSSQTFSRCRGGAYGVVQLQGLAGVGKSNITYHVGRVLEEGTKQHKINFSYVYLNLGLESATRFVLCSSIALKINPELKIRNMSAKELLTFILCYLRVKALLNSSDVNVFVIFKG